MIKTNMNYFIKTIKKHKIIGRRKCINLNICDVNVLSKKLETKVKSSIRKEIMRGGFFLKKRNVLAIVVSVFYWIICWSFCNNCHSILLAHYPNECWLRCHDYIFLGYQKNISSSQWTECTVRRNRGNLRLGKVLDLWFFVQKDSGHSVLFGWEAFLWHQVLLLNAFSSTHEGKWYKTIQFGLPVFWDNALLSSYCTLWTLPNKKCSMFITNMWIFSFCFNAK